MASQHLYSPRANSILEAYVVFMFPLQCTMGALTEFPRFMLFLPDNIQMTAQMQTFSMSSGASCSSSSPRGSRYRALMASTAFLRT